MFLKIRAKEKHRFERQREREREPQLQICLKPFIIIILFVHKYNNRIHDYSTDFIFKYSTKNKNIRESPLHDNINL